MPRKSLLCRGGPLDGVFWAADGYEFTVTNGLYEHHYILRHHPGGWFEWEVKADEKEASPVHSQKDHSSQRHQ